MFINPSQYRKPKLLITLILLLSKGSTLLPMQNQLGNHQGMIRAMELGFTTYLLTLLSLPDHIIQQIAEYLKKPLPVLAEEHVVQLLRNVEISSTILPNIDNSAILLVAYQADGTLCVGGSYINKIYNYKPQDENWKVSEFAEEKFKDILGRADSGNNLPLHSKLRHPTHHHAPHMVAQNPNTETLTVVKTKTQNANICLCDTQSGALLNDLKIECEDFALSHDGKHLACIRRQNLRVVPQPNNFNYRVHRKHKNIMDESHDYWSITKCVVLVNILHLEEFLAIKYFLEYLPNAKLLIEHHNALADCLYKKDQQIDYAPTINLIKRIYTKAQYSFQK